VNNEKRMNRFIIDYCRYIIVHNEMIRMLLVFSY